MKFTIQTIADSIDFSSSTDLYPGYSDEHYVPGKKNNSEWDNFMFDSKRKFTEYAKDIINIFSSFPKEFPIYRSMSLKSMNDINMENLGESWSFDLESAKQFAYHNNWNGIKIILSAIVNSDNINWYESMYRYLRFTTGYDELDENEIVVIDTNRLKNVTISKIKDAKEIGENPIFSRTPFREEFYVKSFENWLIDSNFSTQF